MPNFFVELNVSRGRELELERAARMLESAEARMGGTATVMTHSIGGRDGGAERLVCLIEADTPEAADRVMRVALVPHGRIREISERARNRLLRARYPRGDVDPRLEAELVQDVVDVSLDGALGEE